MVLDANVSDRFSKMKYRLKKVEDSKVVFQLLSFAKVAFKVVAAVQAILSHEAFGIWHSNRAGLGLKSSTGWAGPTI